MAAMCAAPTLMLEAAPALVAGVHDCVWLTEDGEIERLPHRAAARRLESGGPVYLLHAPATAARIGGGKPSRAFDLLELFAFAAPARFCVPTPRGLAEALQLPIPQSLEDQAILLPRAAQRLLKHLMATADRDPKARRTAFAMVRGGWTWGPAVLAALGEDSEEAALRAPVSGLDVWKDLPEWQDEAPPPPPGDRGVDEAEARMRLSQLLGEGAEARPSQSDYASAVSAVFQPRREEGAPTVVLAEAGTGVGKTLGYIAPASVWAEKNEGPVWLSTYTRNLQHQIDAELDRLFPNAQEKEKRVVLRKGRENYLCLLNMEETARGVAVSAADAVPLGLLARWVGATRDGDMTGGDFPAWLVDLTGGRRIAGLTDRRGECIYTACAHYSRCFIEHSTRRARRADLVVANHALVMVQAARGALDLGGRTTRLVFDEGHHVFDAADSAFSAHLSGMETAELRRWLRGSEGSGRNRARGLKARCEDLLGEEDNRRHLDALLYAAAGLPGDGWHTRLADGRGTGPVEQFLAAVRGQVYARSLDAKGPFGLEVETNDPAPDLVAAAEAAGTLFQSLGKAATDLRNGMLARLSEEAEELESAEKARIDQICRSLQHRVIDYAAAAVNMTKSLDGATPDSFVDWFDVDRIDGRDLDVGMRRHWIDPTFPFAETVLVNSHGTLLTSATLTDGSGDAEADWKSAERRAGTDFLPAAPIRARVPSPFDYPANTKVLIVTDVNRNDVAQVAAAYRALFQASGGGALGLFTAIARLRAVYSRIAEDLESEGIDLLAQHVDALNLPTLIDMFRAEPHSCLLGTDAIRDGVDVPGDSLRLIVFDRVPWPRPTILHKARRAHFGGKEYDDALTRLKLKQAFGRLIRRATDRGVFVLLDSRMPSRLLGAFPDGVAVERIGLKQAVETVAGFLSPDTP
ncbi:ATP-dependent DNA helicase [Pacificispira spongiicola]|nr:ATP-dependent DNA helicase [Pacificispira spongiicola]